jgi:hypothetical protein
MKAGPGQPPGWVRRRRRRWIAVGIATLVLAAGALGAWQWKAARAAPEPAPRFNLMGSTGKVYTLDDFLGKQEVVLIFYMGTG